MEIQKDYYMCERLVSPEQWQLKLDAIFAFGVLANRKTDKCVQNINQNLVTGISKQHVSISVRALARFISVNNVLDTRTFE